MTLGPTTRWLALLHQLPAKPPYLRVKIWRKLQAIGAVPLKNAVHVLPDLPQTVGALEELLDEIRASGGEAILIEAKLLAGQTDGELRAQFDAARDADYEEVTRDACRLIDSAPLAGAEIDRLRRRLDEIARLDFFGAHGRQGAEAALRELEARRFTHPDIARSVPAPDLAPESLRGRTWVTRRGVHVDRIACAWLIRRWVDPDAAFRFVDAKTYEHVAGELRFDMADAEFTHEGDRCSFETILLRARLDNPALAAIGEVIHELDITDGKFDRPEALGFGAVLTGICTGSDDDEERIARGSDAIDQLHTYYSRKNMR